MQLQRFYHGDCNGNDFVIILKEDLCTELTPSIIQNLCSFNEKIVDGLLLVDTSVDSYDFKMDYYNNDGTWETMCVNGALCTIQLLQDNHFIFNDYIFKAGDGEHQIKFSNNLIHIKMITPTFKTNELQLHGISGKHINSGAKHFVLLSDITDNNILYNIAQKIRYDDCFYPEGININFLHIINSETIRVITYEKGIENLMDSCGSGSVAAAFYASSQENIISPLHVINPGGNLTIHFNQDWDDVWISSQPQIIQELSVELL